MATHANSTPAPSRRLLRAAGPCAVLTTADVLAFVADDTPEVGSADLDALLADRPENIGFVAIQPEMFRSADEIGNSDLVPNYPVYNGVVAAPSRTADAVLDTIRREIDRQETSARIETRRRFSSAVQSRVTRRRTPSPAPVRIRS